VAEGSLAEPQEPMPCVEDHDAEPSSEEAAERKSCSEGLEPGCQKTAPRELYTEEQRVVGWAENDEKPRSEVLSLEGSSESRQESFVVQSNSVGWLADAVCIVESHLPVHDMPDSRTAATGRVEEREDGRNV
jgi:hypothetical protein